MAKYRLLTTDELQELEKEFVEYLVVNGIVAEDWELLKKEDKKKAEKIIDLFSDVVFESVLRKIDFLELRTPRRLYCYQCLEEKIILIGLEGDDNTDFTDSSYVNAALKEAPSGIEVIMTEKAYAGSREEELFRMLDRGHEIADGRLFKALALVVADK